MTQFVTPAVLGAELTRYQRPAPDDEFDAGELGRHYKCRPQHAADRLRLIAPYCLSAGIDLGPAIETLESHTEPSIGRIKVYMLLMAAVEAAKGLQWFAAALLANGAGIDQAISSLEDLDLLGLTIVHLQLLAAHQAATT